MKYKAFLVLLLLSLWISPSFANPSALKMGDIPRVMERLFHFHIENKELSAAIVRRSMKLYIEQFDLEKSYLLASEVSGYTTMTDFQAEAICRRVRAGDYSDFLQLQQVFKQAVLRAQSLRFLVVQQVLEGRMDLGSTTSSVGSSYPRSEYELMDRQRGKIARFYSFHESRTSIESSERQNKVFALFEKKVRRFENQYLSLDNAGHALAQERMEHFFALKILKALAKSLDTHTAFFSPEEAYEMRLGLEKQFEGVGVILSEGIDGVMIADLIPGSPAESSGQIQVNDLLVEIDGQSIADAPFEEILDQLKKRDRSNILLGFKRLDPVFKKEMFFRVSLQKRPISMKDDRIQASYEVVNGGIIGKITLNSFYESSDGASSEKDIKEAIRNFRQHGDLKGLVLDLRENSGGFLGQAVRVAGLFVSNGVIVISKYGKGDIHYLRNVAGKSYFNGPLVILTSKMSASASEIVAQALQDYGVGIVVGDATTFGKGSIQYQTITDESADVFFKVTVGRYYTVSGRSTQITGVIADIVVPTPYAPYNIGERYLEYPLSPDHVAAAYVDSLVDLDAKAKMIFQKRYLPYLQRVVSVWKKSMPFLKQRSSERLANNAKFQNFLERVERVRARQSDSMVNAIDEAWSSGGEDLQMEEAVNIVEDMLFIEEQSQAGRSSAVNTKEVLLPTGS
ncbi:MAG: PDZ domain-containing protein [Chlamydiia bacterium]|nr:PDZ domain-containing protein [Chlamydiia bacterium]